MTTITWQLKHLCASSCHSYCDCVIRVLRGKMTVHQVSFPITLQMTVKYYLKSGDLNLFVWHSIQLICNEAIWAFGKTLTYTATIILCTIFRCYTAAAFMDIVQSECSEVAISFVLPECTVFNYTFGAWYPYQKEEYDRA